MSQIKTIRAREILDSRGNPAVEVKVVLKNGITAKAGVPSGASTGAAEAWELRDGDFKRYNGKGLLKAVKIVNNSIAKVFKNKDVTKQKDIDRFMIKMDGTENKGQLGANAVLGVSLACCRAGALTSKKELYNYIQKVYRLKKIGSNMPVPSFNIFNGGSHADTNLDIQELMIIPKGIKKFKEQVRAGSEIFHSLGKVLRQKGYDTDVGNEGGYAPHIDSTIEAIEMIIQAIKKAGYESGKNIFLGTDIGAATLYNKKKREYQFKLDNSFLTSEQMIELYKDWIDKYPFISIEDGLDEDDWLGWQDLTREIGKQVLLVGDDLFVTNVKRLKQGIRLKAANAVLIKVNQIGTLSETIDCVKLAQKNKYKVVVSHRSGETTDDFIADLAVAVGADYVKMGSVSRGERVVKYNRLMEIGEGF